MLTPIAPRMARGITRRASLTSSAIFAMVSKPRNAKKAMKAPAVAALPAGVGQRQHGAEIDIARHAEAGNGGYGETADFREPKYHRDRDALAHADGGDGGEAQNNAGDEQLGRRMHQGSQILHRAARYRRGRDRDRHGHGAADELREDIRLEDPLDVSGRPGRLGKPAR